jgi:hypothetical protein
LGTLLAGAVAGAALVFFLRAPAGDAEFGPEAVWRLTENRTARLVDCGNVGDATETRCALDVLEAEGAPEAAREFFRSTHWFMQGFREHGVVDVAAVLTPWRANSNDDFLLLNGSPSVVTVEREAPPVAVFGQDPAYEPLRRSVNQADDLADADDLVLWETDELFEGAGRSGRTLRFVFQWSLKDACHACDTGYAARVALEFAPDGTYRSAAPLDICWRGGGGAQRVEDAAPLCPRTARL